MRTKGAVSLRKIIGGSVHRQFKKCGKSNCRCAKGKLHGPYYYHFVFVNGKLKNRYLKASEVEQTKQACLLHRSRQRVRGINSDKSWQQLREIRESLRTLTNLYQP